MGSDDQGIQGWGEELRLASQANLAASRRAGQALTAAIAQAAFGIDATLNPAFDEILQWYHRGLVFADQVSIGASPAANCDLDRNRQALVRALTYPLYLHRIYNTPAPQNDGYVGVFSGDKARLVPLEIGTTEASTTKRHLIESGAVARWPYGSHKLTILFSRPALLNMMRVDDDTERASPLRKLF